MSCNIRAIYNLKCDLRISMGSFAEILALRLPTPENCFLHDFSGAGNASDKDVLVDVGEIVWQSEGSGSTWDGFLKVVVPRLIGSADLVLQWDGGERPQGLRIRDGKATQCDVVMTLREKKPRRSRKRL